MPAIDVLAAQLQDNPHTYANDLSGVTAYIDELTKQFSVSRSDVYVRVAVIELINQAGYPVGHLVWDAEHQTFTFVPTVPVSEAVA